VTKAVTGGDSRIKSSGQGGAGNRRDFALRHFRVFCSDSLHEVCMKFVLT
jgi:hypothetical protein